MSTAEPVFCLLLAFIILGEGLTLPELAGYRAGICQYVAGCVQSWR
ncbi:MAG: hypothetical protein RQM92_00695 [Candidatus Syntrophopropionicum ammoniitolerans]